MGKKAAVLLSWFLFSVYTYVMAVLAVVAWFAGTIPPHKSWFVAMMALGLTPILILNAVNFVVWICRRNWRLLIPVMAMALNYDYILANYQPSMPFENNESEVVEIPDLKIASYNMHGYFHKNLEETLTDILDYFNKKGVDVVCFQEFCKRPDTQIERTNSHYPHWVVLSETVGMQLAVFSKYPISEAYLLDFRESINSAMLAEIHLPQKKIALLNVHFQTTNLNQSQSEIVKLKAYGISSIDGKEAFDLIMQRLSANAELRSEQVEQVCKTLDEKINELPVVLCGDFNDNPSSYVYRQIKKRLIDGFQAGGKGYGYTFNELFKLFRLDYIMYTPQFRAISYFSEERAWSDHNPVMLELVLDNSLSN